MVGGWRGRDKKNDFDKVGILRGLWTSDELFSDVNTIYLFVGRMILANGGCVYSS